MDRFLLFNFLRRAVLSVPAVISLLSQKYIKALGGYEQVRNEYWATVYDAVEGYLTGNRPVTAFRNSMYNAMNSAFQTGAELGYVDGGGEVPLDKDTQAWLDGEILSEKNFINSLFVDLKQNWESKDAIKEAFARADGYAGKLDSIFGQGKMYGANNPMLTWRLGTTEKHCDTCQNLNGKSHRAKWYITNNYIPRKPGADMECGGYNCDCSLTDKDGNEYVL